MRSPFPFVKEKPAATKDPAKDRPALQQALLSWYAAEAKDYPWRRTRDPYAIWISEVMLQQTRIETVLGKGYYENWLKRFPDVSTLAEASEEAVLKAWEGLGYYRRARSLQRAAREIRDRWEGKFPETHEDLLSLSGVGTYTAGAISAFAFNQPEAVVDGNVARVLARWFDDSTPIDSTAGKRWFEEKSRELIPEGQARRFQAAVMELGQRICRARKPLCTVCPVCDWCQVRDPEVLPVKKARVSLREVDEWVFWIRDGERVFLERETGARRNGLWKLPVALKDDEPSREVLLKTRYAITRYKVTLRVLAGQEKDVNDSDSARWFLIEELDTITMGAPYRKVVERLLDREEGDWLL